MAQTQPRNESIDVGVTPVQLMADVLPGQRRTFNITNTSTAGQVISVSVGQDPTNGHGVVLYPGGNWSETTNTGYVPSEKAFNAISDLAGGTVSVYEEIIPPQVR